MKNIIEIKEDGNRLDFLNTYSPIVCGNSNYILKFTFSEPWQKCLKKAAFFVVGEKKFTVDFDGDECEVPIMPNGDFVFVSIVSNDGINQMATTGLRIRLEPTIAAGDLSEYDQLASYLSKVIGEINKISNGEVVAKMAEKSLTQVDLESDQQIDGVKNFVGGIQKNGIDILNKSEIANPNLLINGDFRVNQRGKESYSGAKCYTVDRWLIGSGLKVDVLDSGIKITNMSTGNLSFEQTYLYDEVKQYLGKTLTFSVMKMDGTLNVNTFTMPNQYPSIGGHLSNVVSTSFGSIYVYASGTKVQFTIRMIAGSSVELKYVKLEIGNVATEFIPRAYYEELSLCQRYYEKIDTSVAANKYNILKTARTSNRFYDESQMFMCTKRTLPTVHCYSSKGVVDCLTDVSSSNDVTVKYSYITVNSFKILSEESAMTVDGNVVGYFEADAEIY